MEVWDFDPAETVKEKVSKIGDIKGMKGLKIFFKEVSSTVTSGKHDNEIIGTVLIPLQVISTLNCLFFGDFTLEVFLQTIPSRGHLTWFNLEKKGKCKPQGTLLLKLSFGSEKNKHVAAQEHRHLLRVLLTHQINAQKVMFNFHRS